jgi:transcriptional regulator with XRE-family HTH domain
LSQCGNTVGFAEQPLAKKLGRPQSFIAKYEGGERRIDVIEFIEIARALGADPVKLFRNFVSETASSRTKRKWPTSVSPRSMSSIGKTLAAACS